MLGYQLPGCTAREDCELIRNTPTPDDGARSNDTVWPLLLELAACEGKHWQDRASALAKAEQPDLVDLYLPLCRETTGGTSVLGHLGQSIDGCVATASGDSSFVNDQENISHLHRLRALSDAVIVGAGTIAADDPQLTTRRVPGPNPVRVVLDPNRRLAANRKVFTDGVARTLLIVADSSGGAAHQEKAEVMFVPAPDGTFDLAELIRRLADVGLRRLFVEGGGTTVTRFFEAGLLDRLHLAIAPVFIGRGRPGIRLDAQDSMADCPRPRHRVFTMGEDILFDCDLRDDRALTAERPIAELEIDSNAFVRAQLTGDGPAIRRIR